MSKATVGESAGSRDTAPVTMPQPITIEVTLKTGRKVVLKELDGGQQIRVDELIPIEKALSLSSLRPVAAIREINGHKIPFPTTYRELMSTAQSLLGRELMQIQFAYQKHFGADDDVETVDLSKE